MESVNSFITLADKIAILNKNCVEILTKINDIVASEDDSVKIIYDDNGVINSFSQPTVGNLKNQIDVLNQNMRRMSSIDGFTFVKDGQSYKKIITTDLNRDPAPIDQINQVTTFTPINNHFFESLMNPMLAVSIELTDKVEQVVNKIISRRYIVRFQKNIDGSLTEAGLRTFNSFTDTFLNNTNINISDFISWYDNPSNDGLVLDSVKPFDEQIYDLSLKNLNYYGVFSVIKVEIDDINNKMWYHLNDIKYYGNDGSIKTLSIGDELIINKKNSSTRYKIKEINKDSSNNKIRLEIIEGYDPIVVGTNVLKYYSDISNQKNVKINVGFDEYIVLFIKSINTDNNVVSPLWSKGISFYTNDLILDINNNINLSNYYVEAVYDYGALLRDLITRKLPTFYGATPNPVVLNSNNFEVVQINKHLTDDKDMNSLLKAHSDKENIKTQISQLNTAIYQKTSKLNSGGLTTSEKQTYLNEINKLKSDLKISTENLSSIITLISELNTGSNSDVEPKYRVRGFWTMPEPVIVDKTPPQHVVQFRIQYRYSSKSGNSNNIKTFNYIKTQEPPVNTTPSNTRPIVRGDIRTSTDIPGGASIAAISSNDGMLDDTRIAPDPRPPIINVGKKVSIQSTDVSTTTENPTNGPKYANFSNWVEILSDVRKRYWDESSKQWYWKIEDVSDADTLNINQLDIPISPNERVEIRVMSISEVGWPESLIESDWSDVLTVDFPDSLMSNKTDNEFILSEAAQDKNSVIFETTLSTKGIIKHVEDSFMSNQDYIAHLDTSIQVSLKTENGISNLFEYLTYLTNRITNLEQQISGARGTLSISLYKNTTLLKSITNNSVTNINIECEDYSKLIGTGRTYVNSVYVIDDYIISMENTNQSGNLGFLSNRLFVSGGTNSFYTEENNKTLLIDYNGNLYTQNDNQFIWFADKDLNTIISSGATDETDACMILNKSLVNLGSIESSTIDDPVWNLNDIFAIYDNSYGLLCSVFPYLPDVSNFIESGQDKIKLLRPKTRFNVGLKLFFKLDGSQTTSIPTNETVYIPNNDNETKNRKIRFWFEATDGVNYQFVINFNIKRYKDFIKPIGESSGSLSTGGTALTF